jgi:hypothetical protein
MLSASALATITPWACTALGSSGVACVSLFWTWTCAMSASVPASNVTVIVEMPFAAPVDDR